MYHVFPFSAEFHSNVSRNKPNDCRYIPYGSKVKKNCTQIAVPLKLNLDQFLSNEGRELFCPKSKDGSFKDSDYEFSAAVNHAGSAGFGHYWAIVSGPDGFYYKIDDEVVSQVMHQKSDKFKFINS